MSSDYQMYNLNAGIFGYDKKAHDRVYVYAE